MRLTCRPHAAPEPPEPVAEILLKQNDLGVLVLWDCGSAGGPIAAIKHDGERFVVQSLNDTRVYGTLVDQPPRPSELLEALRPVMRSLHAMMKACPTNSLYGSTSEQINAAIAAFEAADEGTPKRAGKWPENPLEITQ